MAARMEGEFVVFLIGLRVNKPWKVYKWLPVLRAMPRMLKELESHPESGFLGHSGAGRIIVQYRRHETYIVKPGSYEAVYSGMPPFGLGKAGALVAATGTREEARARIAAGAQPLK